MKTRSRPVRHDFGRSPNRPVRLIPGIACAILGTILCVLAVILSQTVRGDSPGAWVALVLGLLCLSTTFVLGYSRSITVTRDKKGEPIVVKNTWVCFRCLGANTLYLNDWEGLYFDFWLDAHEYPLFVLKLGRDRRDKFFTLYHGSDEEQMKDMADAIKEISGLPFERM